MADQKETYGYETKNTGGWKDPFTFVIVGIDCEEEVRPELYDPQRIRTPLEPGLVDSVVRHGVREPVAIYKFRNDPNVYVVDGRQRVRAAREGSKRTPTPILVPCFVVSDEDYVATFIIGNRFRKQNSTIDDARTANQLRGQGYDDTQIASNVTQGGGVVMALLIAMVLLGAAWFYSAVRRAASNRSDINLFSSPPKKEVPRQRTAQTQRIRGYWRPSA